MYRSVSVDINHSYLTGVPSKFFINQEKREFLALWDMLLSASWYDSLLPDWSLITVLQKPIKTRILGSLRCAAQCQLIWFIDTWLESHHSSSKTKKIESSWLSELCCTILVDIIHCYPARFQSKQSTLKPKKRELLAHWKLLQRPGWYDS
jgi:hypothetical protein